MALQGNRREQLEGVLKEFDLRPEVAVETGTWQGDATAVFADMFRDVYTVDISEYCHARALARFSEVDNVKCLYGDSAKVVPILCQLIKEPCFWFLDAHFPDAWPTAKTKYIPQTNPLPLFDELTAICERQHEDIVIVDDVHAFGRKGGIAGLWETVTIKTLTDMVQPKAVYQMWDSYAMRR